MGKKKRSLAVPGSRGAKLADIAAFYAGGSAAFAGLTANQAVAVLEANMPRLKAIKQLEEVDQGKITLDPLSLRELVRAAGLSEEVADAYVTNAIKATWKRP